jgi:hypothetical protein
LVAVEAEALALDNQVGVILEEPVVAVEVTSQVLENF